MEAFFTEGSVADSRQKYETLNREQANQNCIIV